MAATGKEVVRLEQLRWLQPQIVSFTNGSTAAIMLGNGKVVTFSSTDSYNTHLLVRAMYNCFELLQASSEGNSIDITVTTEVPMKTFKTKTGTQEEDDRIYGVTNGNVNGSLRGFYVYSDNTLNITTTDDLVVFFKAVIYVD